jgi:hypothetical protein
LSSPTLKTIRYGYDFPGDIAGFITGSLWNGKELELTYTMRLLLFLYNILFNSGKRDGKEKERKKEKKKKKRKEKKRKRKKKKKKSKPEGREDGYEKCVNFDVM